MSTPKGLDIELIFSDRIKALIGDGSVSSFARLVGLQQAAVDRYARGIRSPNAEALKTIALKCGVTTDWLLGLSDNPKGVSNGKNVLAHGEASSGLREKDLEIARLNKIIDKMLK